MNDTGASPTNRPLRDTAPNVIAREREHPRAPRHEFLVASFYAAPEVENRTPHFVDPRAQALRRKLLTGDFP